MDKCDNCKYLIGMGVGCGMIVDVCKHTNSGPHPNINCGFEEREDIK